MQTVLNSPPPRSHGEERRKQVLTHLYGLPDPPESVKVESDEGRPEEEKETKADVNQKDKSLTDNDTQDKTEKQKDISPEKPDRKEETVENSDKDKDDVKGDHSNNNESTKSVIGDHLSSSSARSDNLSSSCNKSDSVSNISDPLSSSSNKSNTTHTTPTTTTSHLYNVLMAPLDGNSPYHDNILRFGADDTDAGPRKRMRVDNSVAEKAKSEEMAEKAKSEEMAEKAKSEETAESGDLANTTAADTNSSVGMDLTKNQKKKQKKKRRKHLLNKLEVQRAKDFIYSSENEQFSVEKLRTMIEDVTEFLDAIWDVYCSEARLKGESVEEDGYKVAAVLKCLSASGEGSWGDLQLLSRAKSVLVLRSKNLAASTIARVENELGYDTDIRNFIVRMLKFWMGEIVTKG